MVVLLIVAAKVVILLVDLQEDKLLEKAIISTGLYLVLSSCVFLRWLAVISFLYFDWQFYWRFLGSLQLIIWPSPCWLWVSSNLRPTFFLLSYSSPSDFSKATPSFLAMRKTTNSTQRSTSKFSQLSSSEWWAILFQIPFKWSSIMFNVRFLNGSFLC